MGPPSKSNTSSYRVPPFDGICGVRSQFKWNMLPALQPDEKVLSFKKWVWGVSAKSLPTYRLFFSLPPLWEAGFYVTDRRILVLVHIFRLLTQQMSLWRVDSTPGQDEDTIQRVSIGRNRLLGTFLEIVSVSPTKHWYRSEELRLRFYMRNPDTVRRIADLKD